MTQTLTTTIPVAAAIKRETNPHQPPDRRCPECGNRPPAGMVRCPACRTHRRE